MSTAERLAEALEAASLPDLAERARRFVYDDYKGDTPTPIALLVADLEAAAQSYRSRGLLRREQVCRNLAKRAQTGEFDGTKEEAQAWALQQNDPELLRAMGLNRESN